MLLELSIKNFAIIEDLRVEFDKGLNVITGETGSGKSIIIDALSIVLGQRANKDIIKSGKDYAYIEAIFTSYDANLNAEFEKYNIELGDLIVISKEIKLDRPSVTKINGRTITTQGLSAVTSKLIDIFAQHENVSLMNNQNQRILIDSYLDTEHRENLLKLSKIVDDLNKFKQEYEEKSGENKDLDREIDLIKYQIEEIEDANLTEKDDEELENEFKLIDSLSDISKEIQSSISILKSNYEQSNIEDLLDSVISSVNFSLKYDDSLRSEFDDLEDIRYRIKDIAYSLERYLNSKDYSQETLIYLQNRIDIVNNLKKKYGKTVLDINNYLAEVKERLEFLENYESEMKKLSDKILSFEAKAKEIAIKISNSRKEFSKKFADLIMEELVELNIKNAKFRVDFEEKTLSKDGIDNIEFMISTNIGQDYKALSKTASGGEMSRIMLGFKSILAKKDNIQTLIFDEIDTGISGVTAQIVGNKIKKLSEDRQIIVISHLPQIVSLADSHYLIEKTEDNNKTSSSITKLDSESRIKELARLLGGMEITEKTIGAAREMLNIEGK